MGPFMELCYEYSIGRNLIIFNKDYNTVNSFRGFKSFKNKVLTAKHRRSLRLLYIVGGN